MLFDNGESWPLYIRAPQSVCIWCQFCWSAWWEMKASSMSVSRTWYW